MKNKVKTIAYLLYGSRREYQLELTYSIMSAVHFLGRQPPDYRIVLITDEWSQRPDLPIEHLIFSKQEFHSWTRADKYRHEAKVHALIKAMDHYKGPVALIDTDTYFKDHPDKLFQRIGPGRSVMHSFEGTLQQYDIWKPLLERANAPIAGYRVAGNSAMINSGVVGLDFSDRGVLDEVVPLIGNLYDIHPIFNIEQFALASALKKYTEVFVCPDVVYHYWGYERGFLHSQIGQLYPRFSSESFNQTVVQLPRLGYPRKQRSDQLKAMLVSFFRRNGKEYQFAYIAYLCALRQLHTNIADAGVWARIALTVLKKNKFPVKHILGDFGEMKAADWLDPETKRDWIQYWDSIASRG